MSLLSFIARQRSSLLVIFLVLLALTLYQELEGTGEENILFVTDKNKEVTEKRIFELKVPNDFKESPDDLESEVSVNKTEKQKVEPNIGKISPRCHFRAPLENRWHDHCSLSNNFCFCFVRTVTFPCGHATGFISIVKSVCKTQLGNQLSSFATLVYFQVCAFCLSFAFVLVQCSVLFCLYCCTPSIACLVLLPRKNTEWGLFWTQRKLEPWDRSLTRQHLA